MSNLACQAGHMKIKTRYQIPLTALIFEPTIIAHFGPARLVRHWSPSERGARHELIGGTADDQAAAREWCSLFAPEIVFSSEARLQRCPTGRSHPARIAFAV